MVTCFIGSQQNTWACSNGGKNSLCSWPTSSTCLICGGNHAALQFLLFHNVLPPTTSSITHLVPCLMWMWKTHFTQVRNVDVHLVAKFGDGLKVKFVHTPHTANFTACHLLFVVSGVHHVHTLPDTELHTHSIQILINLTPCWVV